MITTAVLATILAAVDPDQGRTSIPPTVMPWPALGLLVTRHAKDIPADNGWSIGGETLDRDYASYAAWGPYLGSLGAKNVRFQAGWARCERSIGVYDFAWLDAMVDDARAQGVQPWLELSYHNPLYGGQSTLGAPVPEAGPMRNAWDAWVTAIVLHFRSRITTWSVWNEPDLRQANRPQEVAGFTMHTIGIVRHEQPEARLWTLSLAGWNAAYVSELVRSAKQAGQLSSIDAILFHGYAERPEESYGKVEGFRKLLQHEDATGIRLLQGENGCPSSKGGYGALAQHAWSEVSQAKWNLRRLLGDRMHGVPLTNLFSISDMRYPNKLNTKGLLRTDEHHAVIAVKPAYHAYRHVCAVLDQRHQVNRSIAVTGEGLVAGALGDAQDGSLVAVLWRGDDIPGDGFDTQAVEVTIAALIEDPVLVDLRTGMVHAVPADQVHRDGRTTRITGLPVYDSPLLLLPRAAVRVAG